MKRLVVAVICAALLLSGCDDDTAPQKVRSGVVVSKDSTTLWMVSEDGERWWFTPSKVVLDITNVGDHFSTEINP